MDFDSILLAKKLGGGGGSATLIDKNISSNGTYNASGDNADGYKKVVVSVPNTYVAGDEGKVVSNGALVSQTSASYNVNGTYDTTLKNSVTVNVPSGATLVASGTFTGNGANNISVSIGKKMPKTDFVFVFYCNDSTMAYDSNYKFATGSLTMLEDISSYDLSTTGNDRPIITNLSIDMDNAGTTVNVKPNGRLWVAQNIRNGAVSAFAPSGFVVKYEATGFTFTLSNGNASYKFQSGANYKWKLIYFGDSPSSDIVEVE